MAENDIVALKELASGGFLEVALAPSDIGAATTESTVAKAKALADEFTGTSALIYTSEGGNGWTTLTDPASFRTALELSTNGNAAGLYDNTAGQVGAVVNDFSFRINGDGVSADFDTANLTASRAYGLPDASGTIARTEDFASPPAIGSTTPNSGAFTTLTANAASGSALAVTDTTASSDLNYPLIVQRGTTRLFGVRDDGVAEANLFRIPNNPGANVTAQIDSAGLKLRDTNSIQFSSTTSIFSPDTFLLRDAANALGQRNGVNSQEARLYATFTSSTNYQRMTVKSVRQTLSALSGASATTTGTFIPDGAVVVGVTTRVATLLTGATGYTIGDGTDADRWGDITGTAVGTTSDNRDWTAGTIECFTAGGNVTLTAKTSNFTAGAIEVCVFYLAGEAD